MIALMALALSAIVTTEVRAHAQEVDPAAKEILKRMTDYLGSLKQFSVHTQNTFEDVLDSGHRVDLDVTAIVPVGLVMNVVKGTEGSQAKVATGDYNNMLDKKITEIKLQCGLVLQ